MAVGGVGGADDAARSAAAQAQAAQQSAPADATNNTKTWNLQLAMIALQAAETMALSPAQDKVSNMANNIKHLTGQESQFSNMQSFITWLQGAASPTDGISSQNATAFQNNLDTFVNAFHKTYLSGQSSQPTLGSLTITVKVKNPNYNPATYKKGDTSTYPYLPAKLPASDFTQYWSKWSNVQPPYSQKMFATSSGTQASGVQQSMVNEIQNQVDSMPLFKLPKGEAFTQANVNAAAQSTLAGKLNSTGSDNPLPVTTSSADPQIAQYFSFLSAIPSGTYVADPNANPPVPNWNPPTTPPGFTAADPPNVSIKDALFNMPSATQGGLPFGLPGSADGLGVGTNGDLLTSFRYLAYLQANQSESSSPTSAQTFVTRYGLKSGFSPFSTAANNSIQALTSTSSQLGQTMRSILSTVSIIQNVVSEIIKVQTQQEGTSVRAQLTN